MIIFKYVRYRTLRTSIRTFNDGSIQQPGTFIQQAHSTSSVKGRSRSASKNAFHPILIKCTKSLLLLLLLLLHLTKKIHVYFIFNFFDIHPMINGTSSTKLIIIIISKLVYIVDALWYNQITYLIKLHIWVMKYSSS